MIFFFINICSAAVKAEALAMLSEDNQLSNCPLFLHYSNSVGRNSGVMVIFNGLVNLKVRDDGVEREAADLLLSVDL